MNIHALQNAVDALDPKYQTLYIVVVAEKKGPKRFYPFTDQVTAVMFDRTAPMFKVSRSSIPEFINEEVNPKELPDDSCLHHRKHSNRLQGDFRVLSTEEKKQLKHGSNVYVQANCTCFLQVRITGKPKTWKKTPERVEVPFKFGLYQAGVIKATTEVRVPVLPL
jgi:hypothetical protein